MATNAQFRESLILLEYIGDIVWAQPGDYPTFFQPDILVEYIDPACNVRFREPSFVLEYLDSSIALLFREPVVLVEYTGDLSWSQPGDYPTFGESLFLVEYQDDSKNIQFYEPVALLEFLGPTAEDTAVPVDPHRLLYGPLAWIG